MRTTVTLDDDTEQIVRARMKARGVSFKRALNDAVRESQDPVTEPYRMTTYDMGVPKVDLTKANQLAGELEDQHQIDVMRRGY